MDQTMATGVGFSCEGLSDRGREDQRKHRDQQGQRYNCDGNTMAVSHEKAGRVVEKRTREPVDSMFSHDLNL